MSSALQTLNANDKALWNAYIQILMLVVFVYLN
jgi:hypothetical protein